MHSHEAPARRIESFACDQQVLAPNRTEILRFCSKFNSGIHVCAILPDGPINGKHFGRDAEAAANFVADKNAIGWNVYFSPNEPTTDCGHKPTKSQIVRIRMAHLDVDPAKDGTPFDKDRTLAALQAAFPTILIDSGNGIHAYWVLAEPIAATPETVSDIELVNRALVQRFGGDAAAVNVDRIMRVPGTVNYPNAKKRANGAVPVMARFIGADTRALPMLKDLQQTFVPIPAPTRSPTPPQDNAGAYVADQAVIAGLCRDPALARLYSGDLSSYTGDHSKGDIALCNALAPRTNWDVEQVERIWLNSPLGHVERISDDRKQKWKTQERPEYRRITIDKAFADRPNPFAVAKPKPKFTLLNGTDLDVIAAAEWLVKGVIPKRGLMAVYGISQSGKTFWVIDLAMAIAEGCDWPNGLYRVKPANVVYLALEGTAGFSNRLEAWRQQHGHFPTRFRFAFDPLRLHESVYIAELVEACKPLGPDIVIVIDTMNRATPGLNENSPDDMGRIVEGASVLQRETGGLVIIVAHPGKDAEKQLRGHSSLFAALDTVILIERHGDRRSWKVEKSRDGKDGLQQRFALETVDLGEDEDGDRITSCVVTPDNAPRERPLTANQRLGLEAWTTAANVGSLTDAGEFVGVHIEGWRKAFYAISTADNSEAKKKAFQRVREDLVAVGKLTVNDDVYSVAGPNSHAENVAIAAVINARGTAT